jgi:hypothetical protein
MSLASDPREAGVASFACHVAGTPMKIGRIFLVAGM